MNLSDQVTAAWRWLTLASHWSGDDGIPHRLLQHLEYSGIALLVAALIALPVGALVGHTGRGTFAVVSLANLARAVPTLGLLLLVVTVTSIGLTPVIIPLIALAEYEVPAYPADRLPPELAGIPAVKPGSRAL